MSSNISLIDLSEDELEMFLSGRTSKPATTANDGLNVLADIALIEPGVRRDEIKRSYHDLGPVTTSVTSSVTGPVIRPVTDSVYNQPASSNHGVEVQRRTSNERLSTKLRCERSGTLDRRSMNEEPSQRQQRFVDSDDGSDWGRESPSIRNGHRSRDKGKTRYRRRIRYSSDEQEDDSSPRAKPISSRSKRKPDVVSVNNCHGSCGHHDHGPTTTTGEKPTVTSLEHTGTPRERYGFSVGAKLVNWARMMGRLVWKRFWQGFTTVPATLSGTKRTNFSRYAQVFRGLPDKFCGTPVIKPPYRK